MPFSLKCSLVSLKCSLGLCLTALLAMSGCGGASSIGAVPVTGTVTLDGQPVEGAAVTFAPQEKGRAAAGVTDASGKFVLMTERPKDGAVPGAYRVGITKYERSVNRIAPGETDIDAIYAAAEAAGEDISGTGARRGNEKVPNNLLPERYKDPQSSPLNAQVTEDGENDFTFDLQS